MKERIQLLQGRNIPLPFVRDLAKSESNSIGFLADEALEHYQANGLVIGGSVNNDPTCFALGKCGSATYKDAVCLYMAAVRMDARRHHHASWMLDQIATEGRIRNLKRIQLWCRADLAANELWYFQGMKPTAVRAGGTGRDIPHVCWMKSLDGSETTADVLSLRRRGRAGVPQFLHPQITPADIIDAIRTDPKSLLTFTISNAGLFKPRPTQLTLFPESTAGDANGGRVPKKSALV